MSVFRRRRGHPYLTTAAFNQAANYYSNDAKTDRYYFDDALTMPYVTGDP